MGGLTQNWIRLGWLLNTDLKSWQYYWIGLAYLHSRSWTRWLNNLKCWASSLSCVNWASDEFPPSAHKSTPCHSWKLIYIYLQRKHFNLHTVWYICIFSNLLLCIFHFGWLIHFDLHTCYNQSKFIFHNVQGIVSIIAHTDLALLGFRRNIDAAISIESNVH